MKIRLALPSKGRLQTDTVDLLQACDLKVTQKNPRQYIAAIPTLPQVEVWFQRPRDIVRQVREGVVDLGICGYDLLREHGGNRKQIVVVHDNLGFGRCSLQVIVPESWTHVQSLDDLAQEAQNRTDQALRVVTSFPRLTEQFLEKHQVTPFHLVRADGALEAAPYLGTADLLVDLVETGTTLRENRLKQLEQGCILQSQACLFANRRVLRDKPEALGAARQMLEMFEAHLRAEQHYNLIANVRGRSAESVAHLIHTQTDLGGLQGPTIAAVFPPEGGQGGWFAISIVVRKERLQTAIQQLRAIGGSGVVVSPATFIFEEIPERWTRLQHELTIQEGSYD